MRAVIIVFMMAFVFSAAVVSAQPLPPKNGLYHSFDLPGGSFLTGYFSESWVPPTPGHGNVGNTLNAGSWDGVTLGTEWRVWCSSIAAPPVLISDTRDGNGDGEVTWGTTYMGGLYWFSKDGPWSDDNLIDFTGTVMDLQLKTTYQYAFGGMLIGVRGNVTMIGEFDLLDPSWSEEERCILYEINNIAFFGTTEAGAKPAEFPNFIDPNACPSDAEGLSNGGWGDVTHISMAIQECTVPTRSATWGEIKALYTE